MQKQNENVKVVHMINKPSKGWKGYAGYINKDIIKKEMPDYKGRTFYVCGPS